MYLDEETHLRTATVRALSALVLIEIPAAALRVASAELQAAFGRAFMRIMLQRIRHADGRYLDLVKKTRS